MRKITKEEFHSVTSRRRSPLTITMAELAVGEASAPAESPEGDSAAVIN